MLVPSEELSCVSEPLLRYSLAVLAHPPFSGRHANVIGRKLEYNEL